MTYYIFEADTVFGISFILTTNRWFSSDFDSLEQLIDVGLDDPGKIPLLKAIHQNNPRIDQHPDFKDCKFLFQTDNLETIPLDFPEFFI